MSKYNTDYGETAIVDKNQTSWKTQSSEKLKQTTNDKWFLI